MEIRPVPQRASRGERRRLALGLLVLAPVIMLVLLPAVLGLDRFVITDSSMTGSIGRGAVVLARDVPPGDLQVGDVITFRPPGADSDTRVTHRIVSIEDGEAVTRGDARSTTDPWRLSLGDSTYARIVLQVPWVGYPFLVNGGWLVLAGAALVAMGLAVATTRRPVRKRRDRTLREPPVRRQPLRVG